MIKELLESLKYVGHYFAIFFLRIYIGIYILNLGLTKYYDGYLDSPLLAAQINEFFNLTDSSWMNSFFLDFVRPYWMEFSKLIIGFEIISGILIIMGFLIRFVVISFIPYLLLFSYIYDPATILWVQLLIVVLITLGWSGAGRCVGLDYYFYKRYRGFLW